MAIVAFCNKPPQFSLTYQLGSNWIIASGYPVLHQLFTQAVNDMKRD